MSPLSPDMAAAAPVRAMRVESPTRRVLREYMSSRTAVGGAVLLLVIVLLAQALRWWCIATLGHQWNTRVIVVPGLTLVRRGPYRLLRHPNYVAVVLEGVALPLAHTAWLTAVLFTVLNAPLLAVRIRTEQRALTSLAGAR